MAPVVWDVRVWVWFLFRCASGADLRGSALCARPGRARIADWWAAVVDGCTWLDACLPPGFVPTSTFWGCAVQKGEVGTGARGWAPAYPQALCQPPHSGVVPCRKGRLVRMHVVDGAEAVVM